MSKTTVMVHLGLDTARAPSIHGDTGDAPYVWLGLNEDVQLCVTSLAGAAHLVKLGTEAARMLAEAGAAQESQEPPGTVTSAEPAPDNSYESYQPNRCHAEGPVGGTYPFSCLATKGHAGDHVAYGPAGESGRHEVCHSWAQEHQCGPGACTCGATVDHAGNVTPAGAM